jgi:ribosomal protein S18
MFSLSVFLAISVCIFAIVYSTSVMLEKRYQSVVELVDDKKWYQAEQALKLVSNYKDSEVLKRYVWANLKLELNDKTDLHKQQYTQVLDCLNEIPVDYQGIFKDEISELRSNILEKNNNHYKLMYDYANIPTEQLKSVKIGERYLYFEEEYIEPMFFGL